MQIDNEKIVYFSRSQVMEKHGVKNMPGKFQFEHFGLKGKFISSNWNGVVLEIVYLPEFEELTNTELCEKINESVDKIREYVDKIDHFVEILKQRDKK